MEREPGCTCGALRLEGPDIVGFNLDFDCPVHGTESAWYNSPEQVEGRREMQERTTKLQRLAAQRRRDALTGVFRKGGKQPPNPVAPAQAVKKIPPPPRGSGTR